MTRQEQELVEKLREMADVPWIVQAAVVTEVDEANLICTVTLVLDDTEIPNVRLKAAVDTITDGLVQIPAINSTVLIATINNAIHTNFICAFSQVDKVVFYGGSHGGMVNWPDAKAELDKVKDLLTQFFNVVTGTPINEPGSGAPSAFQAALKALINGKPLPSFEDLEDEKVTH